MNISDYINPISGLSYYLVCKDYQGKIGIEAIGTPEMTRRQVVEDVRDHLASNRPIVHVKLINGNDMQDVTAEIVEEAVQLEAAE